MASTSPGCIGVANKTPTKEEGKDASGIADIRLAQEVTIGVIRYYAQSDDTGFQHGPALTDGHNAAAKRDGLSNGTSSPSHVQVGL